MHEKKIVLTVYVFMFLIALMFSTMRIHASTDNVGVKVGDWAGFSDASFEWESNIPGSEQPPPELNMSWLDMKVLNVSGSNVTLRSTTIYKNGTERTGITSGNVATGEGALGIDIIPSNLGPRDEIPANFTWFIGETLKLVINGTVTRSYAGANREVNYVNITYPIMSDAAQVGTMNMSFYWDKKTGVICELSIFGAISFTVDSMHYYLNMSIMLRMTATNMWPAVFTVDWKGYTFNVTMTSNSTISNFNFNESLKQISFNVTGPTGKAGYCDVVIPKDLLWGEFSVYKDGSLLVEDVDYIRTYNGTHYIFHIAYSHSLHTIEIRGTEVVPEFPTWASALLMPIVLTVAIAVYKRRLKLSC
ncbi:MAG: hypothetical protein ACUVRA_05435 [Candidatus Bathyarchaeaceae archaeon]